MGEQEATSADSNFAASDISTRVRDLDEKNRLIRERVLLLGKNLIEIKEEQQEKTTQLKKDLDLIKNDLDLMKKISSDLVDQLSKFVKRDEMLLLERMLKDFQPLEFMRKRDVERLIDEKLNSQNK